MTSFLVGLLNRFTAFMAALAAEGGPSSTRWIYMRSSEVFWFGWLIVVVAAVYRYVRFADANAGWLTLIGTMAAAGFAFVQQTQAKKIAIDSQQAMAQTGSASSVSDSMATAVEDVKK